MSLNQSYGGVFKKAFGTPSYPSPLDRIRTGQMDRASQLGLSVSKYASFEGNQSFPKTSKTSRQDEVTDEAVLAPYVDLDNSLDKSLKDFDGEHFSLFA